MNAPRFVPVRIAKSELGTTRQTIYRLLDSGQLGTPIRIGNRRYVERAALEAFIARGGEHRAGDSPATG